MPGDELHDEAPRAASGPHPAAPRKPLRTRLHVPRGRVAAIAAMPTAMLMSMGLTPQLAVANPQPENPFSDGPCVSVPDQEAEEAQQQAREEAQDTAAREAADEAAAEAEKRAEKKERAEAARREAAERAEAAAEARRKKAEEAAAEEAAAEEAAAEEERKAEQERAREREEAQGGSSEPEPEPSPSETERNPWDPLGIGDKLKDLFGGDEEEPVEQAEPSEPPATERPATEERAEQDQKAESSSPVEEAREGVRDTADRLTEGLEDTTDKVGEAAEDTRERVEDAVRGEDDQRADAGAEEATPPTAGTDEDGKKPFPCVEEKKSAGTDEATPVVLPNQPWYLDASALTLRGLKYHGVVNVTMQNGQTKQALKFTAESVDIGDLHQTVQGQNGVTYHAQAGKGSTSTIRGGTVTMYTEKLEGNLFGVLPQKYDPEHPPPLDVPFAVFTQVKIQQAGQFGGNLTIPGLQMRITND